MADAEKDDRASKLAAQALDLIARGRNEVLHYPL